MAVKRGDFMDRPACFCSSTETAYQKRPICRFSQTRRHVTPNGPYDGSFESRTQPCGNSVRNETGYDNASKRGIACKDH
eukprot:1562672-Amphidinium_carterae.1